MRSCAYLLDRDKMMEYYETGKDLYYVCAASMMGISYEELKKLPNAKQYRTQFKVILLGLIYGEGAQSLADKLGITLEESKRSIKVLFDNFPQLEKGIYHKKKYPAAHNREIETLWGDTLVSPPTSPDKLERAGINQFVHYCLTAGSP